MNESEPQIDAVVERRRKEAIAKAESRGHSLGNWEWDGAKGFWCARCENRNCSAIIWVSPSSQFKYLPYGGIALLIECSLRRRQRIRGA